MSRLEDDPGTHEVLEQHPRSFEVFPNSVCHA